MKVDFKRWRLIDGEIVFTAILLVIAVYMFVGSYEFSPRAATFPKVISGAAAVGCVLLLVSRYLPEPARAFIEEEARMVQHDDGSEETDVPDMTADHGEEMDSEPINSVYTALLIAGYIFAAYLVSFFIATPLFIIAYVLLFDINRLYGGALLLVSIAIIYGFEQALNVPLDEGLFLAVVG